MVPKDLIGYFLVTAQVAGTLIGLLFVSISLRYAAILGSTADFASRTTAGACSIGLVNTLTISLQALVPSVGLGYRAVVSGLLCLGRTLRLHFGRDRRGGGSWGVFLLSAAAYLAQLVEGSWLIARPGENEIARLIGA